MAAVQNWQIYVLTSEISASFIWAKVSMQDEAGVTWSSFREKMLFKYAFFSGTKAVEKIYSFG